MPIALMVVLGAAGAFAEGPEGPDHYAIRGARINTGTGVVIENGVVLIDDGLITAVSQGAEIPDEAWIIEAAGREVYPGFIDALTDLGLSGDDAKDEDEPAPFATGPEDRPGTTSWLAAADEIDLTDERIAQWRSGGFTSAVISPAKGIVAGQAAFVNLAGERPRDLVVATPVALRVNLEPPGSRRSFPGSLMGVIAYIRQVFLDAAHYREAWGSYEAHPSGHERPRYDRALVGLAKAQTERWPVLFPAHRVHEIERVIGLAKDSHVSPVVYGAHEGYAAANIFSNAGVPALVSAKWPEKGEDMDPEKEESLRVLRLRERAPTTPAALEKAGVRFGFYSDGLKTPAEMLANVRTAVERGLSPEAALAALTAGPAAIFHLDDRLGTLEAGKIANLVITEGDIFNQEATVVSVFIDGRKLEPEPAPETPSESSHGGVR
jgi:imidazolonepropionase-like amidohydrolase